MGDVFIRKARQRRDFKFVYKRKIFLHSHPWPSQDPAFNRLVYLQVSSWGMMGYGNILPCRLLFFALLRLRLRLRQVGLGVYLYSATVIFFVVLFPLRESGQQGNVCMLLYVHIEILFYVPCVVLFCFAWERKIKQTHVCFCTYEKGDKGSCLAIISNNIIYLWGLCLLSCN